MPLAALPQIQLFYELSGPANAPVLLLCNSLGCTHHMWDPQMDALRAHRRVLRYDVRGHGQSDRPPGHYTIAQLADDALALLDHLGVQQPVDFVGLSMGGMTGMWLQRFAPHRLRRVVLCNTSARLGPPELWDQRLAALRQGGMAALVDGILSRWFCAATHQNHPEQVAAWRTELLGVDAEGYASNAMAIRDMDQADHLAGIPHPTRIISGQHDGSTPPAMGQWIAEHIPGADHVVLNAAHLSNVEQPEAFNAAVLGHVLAP